MPEDYLRDYAELLEKLEDPTYGRMACCSCAIQRAQDAKKEIDRVNRYWRENGGETARESRYKEAGEPRTSTFRKQDAMQQVKWRTYNELAEAKNRTCEVVNFFHCPYGDEWRKLLRDGDEAYLFWQQITWYDEHWNGNPYSTPTPSEQKWYYLKEPPIIDVTNYDDAKKQLDRLIHPSLLVDCDRAFCVSAYPLCSDYGICAIDAMYLKTALDNRAVMVSLDKEDFIDKVKSEVSEIEAYHVAQFPY